MSQKFSKELVNRLKRYFQKYHNLAISDELAYEYLDSLADLYLSFCICERPSTEGRVSVRRAGGRIT